MTLAIVCANGSCGIKRLEYKSIKTWLTINESQLEGRSISDGTSTRETFEFNGKEQDSNSPSTLHSHK